MQFLFSSKNASWNNGIEVSAAHLFSLLINFNSQRTLFLDKTKVSLLPLDNYSIRVCCKLLTNWPGGGIFDNGKTTGKSRLVAGTARLLVKQKLQPSVNIFFMVTRKGRRIRETFVGRWYVEQMISVSFLYAFLCCTCFLFCSARDSMTKPDNLISDSRGETLVSTGNKFELGFFTPNGSSDRRRYLGIWYYRSNPQTVVWVANRDNPVLDDSGVFAIAEDGNLKLFDESGRSSWSTNLERSSSMSRTAKIMDTGNLVVSDEDQESQSGKILWQSFDNPTDTFLPGMKMDENIILTSWTSYANPAPGNFTFQLDQEGETQFIIWKRSMRYWKSGVSGKFIGSDQMPSALSYLLSNFTSSIRNETVPYLTSALYSDTRMIMTFAGQIQFFKWKNEKVWSLIWAQPRDRCSVYNACGNFGICNSNNKLLCKCLPGFEPSLPQNWNSGDFSGGCSRKTTICGKNSESNTFLSLHMMNVGNPDSQFKAKNEMECKLECLNNCQCQAYSYQEAEITQQSGTDVTACWIWSVDLNNLQEEYESGGNLNVRVAGSDVELLPRHCEICGTNTIPYPLSTGPNCGDATYFNFRCNISTGQVSFVAAGGTYRITRINSETKKLVIQTNDGNNCEGGNSRGNFLRLDRSSPFNVTGWCDADPFTGTNEVEISWKPPPQPTCALSEDCKGWPNSSCNETGDGKKKCLCDGNFQWDSSSLSCIKVSETKHKDGLSRGKMPLSLIIAVTFISLFTLICLASTILYIYLQRRKVAKGQGNRGGIRRNLALQLRDSERHVKDLIDSGRFKEDDAKGIEVPFFDFESILAATNNFSSANRLGQGGFGPVYKAQFPGGQEIAVKRLSSCSGQGLEEFKNEVVLIAKLQHRNLVRLMGYFASGDEKMLLYEYMPNRSLDSFIFDQKLCKSLNWELRYYIILGIARGLLYLHQDSRLRIIHRDLKTSNILLDEEMNPKISDFGLARIFGGKETAANTKRVVGTYGYMSPEYALDGFFSFKSDVFSFGVVVLEIISGKRNTGFYQPEQNLSLLGYAWQLWKEDKALNLLDQTIRENCDANEVFKCLTVGLLCVQEDPSERPTMSNVVFMLGSETATLPTPKQPAFVVRRCASSRASSFSKPETYSQNELTVTLEDGR